MSSAGPLHLNTLIHNIISLLKRYEDGLSFEKLKSLLNLDITTSPELMSRLRNNPRIVVSETRLIYRPPFAIKCSTDLIEYLKANDDRPGVLLTELRESYKSIDNDINQSSLGDLVYKLTFNDSSAVHLNKLPGVRPAPEEVKSLWNSLSPATMTFTE